MNNKTILVLLALSALLMITSALAESGNMTIVSDYDRTGLTFSADTAYNWGNASKIYFDITDYKNLVYIQINATGLGWTFGHPAETTTFTCLSPNSCSGIAWYDKNLSRAYWAFTNSAVSVSPINLSYTQDIFLNVTGMGYNNGASCFSQIGATVPACIETANHPLGIKYNHISVQTTTTDQYNVSYFSLNGVQYFTANITKTPPITKWYSIEAIDNVSLYFQEPGQGANLNAVQYTGVYGAGLRLKGVLANTGYTIKDINSSGAIVVTPVPIATINPTTGKGIIFDADSYTVGQTANISWIIDDSIWNLFYSQSIAIKKVGVDDQGVLMFTAPKNGSIQYTFTNCAPGNTICGTGAYEVVLYRSLLGFFESSRETDTANVFTPTAYITAPMVVNEGQSITVGYMFGLATNTGFIIDDKLSEFLLSTGTPIYTNLGCPCALSPANKTITFVGTGKHRLSLFDATAINNVASIIITVLPSDTVIGQNITSNYFTVDKAVYNFGDIIYGQYQVSTSNWSTYPIMLAELTSSSQIPMGNVKLNSQTGGFEIPIDASQINFIQGGVAYVNLSAKSSVFNTTTVTLYSIPISINLNKNGWSVAVSKKEVCNGQAFKVDYTSPTGIGKIVVSYFSHGVNKQLSYDFNTNGSKNVVIPDATINAGVAIDIQDTNGVYQIGTIVKVVDSGCVAVTTAPPAKTSDQAQTDISNLLQSNMFWALIITVGLMVVVAIETSKNGSNPMIPSLVSGFLGIAAFTIIGWIPSWITFSVVMLVLVVFAWQQARNINTAGE